MSRLSRLFEACLRILFGLGTLSLMLLALGVSLGRQLAPLVADTRLEVQARVRDVLGMPVLIRALEGEWTALVPRLLARDVTIGEGADALHLERVQVRLDLLRTLMARELRVAALELEGVRFALVQDAEGRWTLEGAPQRGRQRPFNPDESLRALERIDHLSLLDSQITFAPHGQAPFAFRDVDLTLRSDGWQQRLDGRLSLPDGQPLQWRLQGKLADAGWRQSDAELYVSLPQSDWAGWVPHSLTGDWQIERLRAGGEVWLSWAEGRLQRAASRLQVPELRVRRAGQAPAGVRDLALNGHFLRDGEDFRALLDSLAVDFGPSRWTGVQIALEHRAAADAPSPWTLTANRLDLTPLMPLVQSLAPLPEGVGSALAGLRPRGILRNLRLDYRPQSEDGRRLAYAANLEGVAFDAWNAVPAADNVDGSVSGDLAGGELRLNGDDFVLHLAHLFPRPWRYRHAAGRLLWQVDEQGVTLRSPYIQTDGEEGRTAIDFLIRLRRDPAEEDYMDLRVGLRDGDARYTEKYLPTLSPGFSPPLAEWLKTSIRAGRLDEGQFFFQGALNKGAEAGTRSLGLFFKVRDLELAYQPGWPELREAWGEIFVEGGGVQVNLDGGRVLDSQLTSARAEVPAAKGGIPMLHLESELESSVGDGLRILREAPLETAKTFAGWAGEGPLQGRLTLDIPLRRDSGRPPRVVAELRTEGAQLRTAQPDLQLNRLRGAFTYDTARGLSAPDLRAEAFGRPIRGRVIAEGRKGRARTRIQVDGQMPSASFAEWLQVSRRLPLSGELPYRLELLLDGANSRLQVDSTLRGLRIDLPEPFGKSAQESRDTRWYMTLEGAERRYRLDYADRASLALAAPPGRFGEGRGELLLGGGQAQLPATKGLWLRGRIATLDWDAWQALLAPLAGQAASSVGLLRGAELDIGSFQGFGTTLRPLGVLLTSNRAGWNLQLDGPQIKGRIAIPATAKAPIDIDLSHLQLPATARGTAGAPAGATAGSDPLLLVDPRKIPALDVRIARLQQGAELLGAWSFKAQPLPDGVQFSDLDLDLKGLRVLGSAGWQGAPGATRSWFRGRLQGGDLADVLLAWGFAPTATSRKFRVDIDGSWPGSPAAMTLRRYTGSFDISLRKGQFREVDGAASALRMFGVLNFNSIGRRLRLDFSDLFGKGLSYDRVKGLIEGRDGVYRTEIPLTLSGPSSNLELDGRLDLPGDTIDAKLLVTLPVSNNLPLAALMVGAPAVGGALFVVDKLLGNRVARFASVQYRVQGPWQEPRITFEKPFEKPR
ncbi:TIGR02099 family protein [Azotobacter beijerinckii]|uniref:TIGR02099 family protein n=1 Tax=Azotobacter beijerinckii TaxID=170623 RepID=A0A1H6RSK9_9GAMM|nr:YhdP family protein [Azotobacter beijerinckii]SEI58733.1 TIGR02099 family protein [Azotobacter beijerinckii]